jgi:hypothetical protein
VYDPAVTDVEANSLAPTAPVAIFAAVTELSESEPPPEDANVIVSFDAFVVIVILLPAARVKVSVAPSATTSSCPDTDIVLNVSVTVPDEGFAKDKVPLPSVVNTWLALPSVTFNWSIPIWLSSMCLVRILFEAIFVPSTALSAILPVAIVFAAIWSVVIWSSSICLVKILFDAIFVPSIALSATFPVAIVFAAI